MNISPNGLIALEYHPATDILTVELPDIQQFMLNEVERSLHVVVEAVLNYDIKKMLLDSSRALVEVNDEEYKRVVSKFGKDLTRTRLQRLARVGGSLAAQEQRASQVAEELQQSSPLPVEFRSFDSKAEALEWLEASA